jgi:serine/threonine protein phosphatase PrpC
MRVLAAQVPSGTPTDSALTAATAAAQAAVGDMAVESGDAPATTIVCACVTADAVTLCWVGDSRAYWLASDDSDSQLLTQDDSVSAELVAAGVLTEDEAVGSPHEHVLTRWLGADAQRAEPHVASFEPRGPGFLLLCSDGLWNYQPSAADLATLAVPSALSSLADAAARLVEFALDRGGQDNITAVLSSFPPR